MASSAKPENAPEETPSQKTSSQETASQETAPEENMPHRFGLARQWRTMFVGGFVGLLTVTVLELTMDYAGGAAPPGWAELAVDASLLAGLGLAGFNAFRGRVEVGAEEIRKVQPLWSGQSVQISEIRRVHVPTTESGLWLYTDLDGDAALTIGRRLEDHDRLKELVIQSVPSEAKITGLGQEERMS